MPTPIEPTLSTLLPTLSLLPPELIHLSTSLLAQSRAKAATLKPEEEIARTYACCHIACQRLGHKLALEIAKPAPPVKPKVYNKLHAYFNSVLATPRTARKGRVAEDRLKGGGSGRKEGSGKVTTPAKNDATTTTTPSSSTGKRKADAGRDDDEISVPQFVMPLIRQMCKAFNQPEEAAPHIFAGVQSVLQARASDGKPRAMKKKILRTPTKSDRKRRIEGSSIPALVTAVFLAVGEKMCGSEKQDDIDDAVTYAEEFCGLNPDPLSFALPTKGLDVRAETLHLTHNALPEWTEMEWYQNVPSLQQSLDEAEDEDEDESANLSNRPSKTPLRRREKHGNRSIDNNEAVGAAGLLPGLGTMFQPAIDWLSEERRAEYAEWKRGILWEVRRAEQKV